jgi:hypothetical protein
MSGGFSYKNFEGPMDVATIDGSLACTMSVDGRLVTILEGGDFLVRDPGKTEQGISVIGLRDGRPILVPYIADERVADVLEWAGRLRGEQALRLLREQIIEALKFASQEETS